MAQGFYLAWARVRNLRARDRTVTCAYTKLALKLVQQNTIQMTKMSEKGPELGLRIFRQALLNSAQLIEWLAWASHVLGKSGLG